MKQLISTAWHVLWYDLRICGGRYIEGIKVVKM